jgi:NhaP-type Na+/H+ or K+/H+ antiporter
MAVELADTLPAKIALIGALGVGAQWLAWRLQWPAIVLMSLAGLIVGPVAALALGAPILDPAADFGDLLRPAIAVSVAVILFEGGLALDFAELRGTSKAVRRLVIVGAPVGWILGAVAARHLAGLPWDIAWLFGGLLVVTGPTVILPLLRQAKLAGRPAAILKWEGIVNDPVGALAAVFVYEVIRFTAQGEAWFVAAGWIVGAAVLGGLLGLAAGFGLARAFRGGLAPEFLKAPMILAAVLACFAVADAIAHETGLLAVTVFGITLGNSRLASIGEMRRFKETIAVLLVSGVFVILTASLTPETIRALDWRAAAFVAAMLFVVRPVTVWTATAGSGLSWRERALVGWIAPRGIVAVAVAGFFAGELSAIGRTEAEALTPLAFAMVFATVILHGFTIKPIAARLGLAVRGPEGVLIVGANTWSLSLAKTLQELDIPVLIADTNWLRLRRARLDGVPTFYGEILSEAADHRLDHAKYGWLVAASSNDAYNALACVEFAPEIGRHRVFQLPAGVAEKDESREIVFTARGRTLIRKGRSFDALSADWFRGWRFRATKLSEEYPLKKFLEERGENVDLVAERRPDGKVQLLGPTAPPKGGDGAVMIWFAPPKPEDESEAAPEEA